MALITATVPLLDDVPGLVHGFERRAPTATTVETRDETRARVARALQAAGRLLLLRQVHGAAVVEAPWDGFPEADAALAWDAGHILGIETADCLPLLLVDTDRRVVAAAHAGWRGTALGVATRLVEALLAGGSRPPSLRAALGPSIGACCYEVGEDVREAFGARGDGFFRPGPRGRPHLDVPAANRTQLLAAGLAPEAIVHVDECTRCRPGYYSYRRDGKGAGRMISFVGFRA